MTTDSTATADACVGVAPPPAETGSAHRPDDRERALLDAHRQKHRSGQTASVIARRLASPVLGWGMVGVGAFLAAWYLVTETFEVPGVHFFPSPVELFREWVSREPTYGVSIFTPIYYEHIATSVGRVFFAFVVAVGAGVPLGILLGWSRTIYNLIYPLVELLRPIPPLAWVPLAVLMLPGTEIPVVFVTLLAAFFATVLNTLLGVRSIDGDYFRAAQCMGFTRYEVLRRVVIPGALPHVFTGLQIAMGVAWFSLVGGELIAGRSGLGFLIFDAYMQVALPNIFIGMITLGLLGYVSSAAIRRLGRWLMAWQESGKGA